jgi:hypothetical protein
MTGIEIIQNEREKQVQKGWTPEHDDLHTRGELAYAAVSYAVWGQSGFVPTFWPWQKEEWKPEIDPIDTLAKAGALIVAEIERIQRLRGE